MTESNPAGPGPEQPEALESTGAVNPAPHLHAPPPTMPEVRPGIPLPSDSPAGSHVSGQPTQGPVQYAQFAPPGTFATPQQGVPQPEPAVPPTQPGVPQPVPQHLAAQHLADAQYPVEHPTAVLSGAYRLHPDAPADQVWLAEPSGRPGGVPQHAASGGWAAPPVSGHTRRGIGAGAVVGILTAALVFGAIGGIAGPRIWDLVDGTTVGQPLPPISANPDITRPDGSIADIAAKVGPSVVSILVAGTDGMGTGSGFIIQQDGYILTNNHVIAGAVPDGKIRVTFVDGTESEATLVGRTSDYDIAVIKVDRTGLVPLALGDSDLVAVGDPVIAIGAPLGLDGTVTSGIISALNRPVTAGDTTDQAFINAIQTDAAINPGNSGGPLVNGSGEVIGINSAIAQPPGTQAAGNIGLGFAIGSNQARRTADEIIATGWATYPVIGVLLDSTYDGEGVQVVPKPSDGIEPVTPGGPADKAGIVAGDVILAIDGRPVTQSDELIVAIRALAPGDTVVLKVRSGSNERDVSIVLDQATSGEG